VAKCRFNARIDVLAVGAVKKFAGALSAPTAWQLNFGNHGALEPQMGDNTGG